MENNEVQIPQLGGIGKLTPEEIQSILGAVKDNFSGIRNDAGQYTVDYKRLRDIRNYNLAPDVRAAKAIVSPSGQATGGDFTDIQDALDYVNSLGGGTVLCKGALAVSADITLYSNISLISDGTCTLTASGGNGTINIKGTAVISYGSGSGVDITNGDATVTDGGATWQTDGVQAGDSFYVYGVPYEVDSLTNETTLELTTVYNGKTETGANYRISRPIRNVTISGGFTFNYDASTSGIEVDNAEFVFIKDGNVFNSCKYGIFVDNAFNVTITENYAFGCVNGFLIRRATGSLQDCFSFNNTGNGIQLGWDTIDSDSALKETWNFNVINNQSLANGGHGILCGGAVSCILGENQTRYNVGDGIRLYGGTDI